MAASVGLVAWTDELEEDFALYWAERPCLFDISCADYRDRIAKNVAVQEIAEKISVKIKSIRTQYGKIRRMPPSGSASKGLSRRDKIIIERFKFLEPYTATKKTTSNYQISVDEDLEDTQQNEVIDDNSDDIDDDFMTGDDESFSFSPKPACKPSTKRPLKPKEPSAKTSKKFRDEKELAVLDGLTKFLGDSSKSTKVVDENEIDDFCKYVSKSMNKFDARTQSVMKNKIQNLIHEAEMGMFAAPAQVQPQHVQPQHVQPHSWHVPGQNRPMGQQREPLFTTLAESMNMYNS